VNSFPPLSKDSSTATVTLNWDQEPRSWLGTKRERVSKRDILVGGYNKDAVEQHAGGKVPHHRLSLGMQVLLKHLIGAPVTKETDDVCVDLGTEKGDHARGLEGSGRYVR
jgi:hypothetical protein